MNVETRFVDAVTCNTRRCKRGEISGVREVKSILRREGSCFDDDDDDDDSLLNATLAGFGSVSTTFVPDCN